MDLPIRNINDLRAEIFRIKELEREQSFALGQRFKSPTALFLSIKSLFPRSLNPDGTKSPGFFDQDMVGIISRFVLPFTLNKTIFRHSNFVIKTLVGLVSQKASHFITEDSVTGIWDKVTSLFKSKAKSDVPTPQSVPPVNVPPISETH
jgi:hypothetical protein